MDEPRALAAEIGLALHVGADELTGERHSRWPSARFCRRSIERVTRLCAAAGIREQAVLVGAQATRARVREALVERVTRLAPDGLLVVTFAGHSERDQHDPELTSWCLHDGLLDVREVAAQLARLPASARVVVVSDTCYAAALGRHIAAEASVTILASCGPDQSALMLPESEFVARLEELVLSPACASFAWLHERLQEDAPDVEMPEVWSNGAAARQARPFAPARRA